LASRLDCPLSAIALSLEIKNWYEKLKMKKFLFNLLLVVSEMVIAEFVVWLQSWGE